MPLEYQVFDPGPCGFPRPRVSLLPRGFDPAGADDSTYSKGFSQLAGQGLHFSRGRYALGEAYRLAGLDSDGVLLAPAYHCVTMLDPALALGAEVRLYPLTADLAPDLAALDELADRAGKPAKVLLATHFFGFVRDFSELKQWCQARNIVFVEDCSHTLFTKRFQAKGAGQYGKFVASSPYKFFPSVDGGWLYASDGSSLAGRTKLSPGWIAELRALKQYLDAARHPRMGASDIADLREQAGALTRDFPKPGLDRRCHRQAQSTQYDVGASVYSALRGSRWLIDHSSIRGCIQRRQGNYQRWLQGVARLPNCHPLYPELPDDVVPYMFPLYIEHPMPHFYWLKHLAVPVWRWDEMALSDCTVAKDYRLHLLHLPCHQALSDDEMNWMLTALENVLRAPALGASR